MAATKDRPHGDDFSIHATIGTNTETHMPLTYSNTQFSTSFKKPSKWPTRKDVAS